MYLTALITFYLAIFKPASCAQSQMTWLQTRDDMEDYSLLATRHNVAQLSHCLAWIEASFNSATARLATFSRNVGECRAFACRLDDLPSRVAVGPGGPGCRKCRSSTNLANPIVWLRQYAMDCWTTVQHRVSGSVDFQRDWADYRAGFGEGAGANYWIGLDSLYALTNLKPRKLLILMKSWNNSQSWAMYSSFAVDSPAKLFQLSVSGFSGSYGIGDSIATPWDSMDYVITNGQRFSTIDNDNDKWDKNCAVEFKGAWWFNRCFAAHLNGQYHSLPEAVNTDFALGINWMKPYGDYYSLKEAEMLVY